MLRQVLLRRAIAPALPHWFHCGSCDRLWGICCQCPLTVEDWDLHSRVPARAQVGAVISVFTWAGLIIAGYVNLNK